MIDFLALELRDAIMSTIKISGLEGRVALYKAPTPGRIMGAHGSRLDFLAADKATGHAIGSDLVLIDEAGLMQENQRALWNALYSSISGRNGWFWAISIQGTGPMFAEMGGPRGLASAALAKMAGAAGLRARRSRRLARRQPGARGRYQVPRLHA